VSTPRRIGFGPWRLLLPLVLAAATVAALLSVQQFAVDQRQMHETLRMSEGAAATLARARLLALQGQPPAFEPLEAARALVPGVVAGLGAFPPKRALTLLPPDPAPLRSVWEQVAERAERMAQVAPQVESLAADAERLQSIATGLLVRSDELVDALIAREARPAQVRAAARQLVLVQRISTNLQRLLEPNAGLLAAADRLGRDAVVFGEVATGLLNGSRELGIPRVEVAEGREILATVGREFRVLAEAVESVVAGGAGYATLARRGEQLATVLQRLELEHGRVRSQLQARLADRVVTPVQVTQLAVLTSFALIVALVLSLVERRAYARSWEARAARHEEACAALEQARDGLSQELEQLASDIHRIADGDAGLRAHAEGADTAAVGVARAGLDRLRQQLRERAEDGARLTRSGQLVGQVSGQLREAARRHAYQAEEAGQATRIMAAALESVRAESARVSEAARQSGSTAQQAGQALGETLHELDAVRAGVEDCAERVRALEGVTRELRAVRTLVEDVGELGKMLSLNVAIQASVDSAASRALAAFSEEVQRLSTRARSAVSQVEAIHGELRAEAERAASAVKESVWRARGAAERARGAHARLDELAGSSRHLEELNHSLSRVLRDHAVNVTDVVRAITALHALTREVREQVDATADSATAFADTAAVMERRLAAPASDEPVIHMHEEHADTGDSEEPADDDARDPKRRALQRWS
jgi:twitching motility protein PilJ